LSRLPPGSKAPSSPLASGITGHGRLKGLEVLRRIKAEPQTRTIPVAILTDSQQHRDLAECRLGVQAHLVKPVDFSRFTTVTPQLNLQWALLKSGSKVVYTEPLVERRGPGDRYHDRA